MTDDQTDIISDRVMGAIAAGHVKMHSRWYFRRRMIASGAAVVVLTGLFVWDSSFVLFLLDHSGRAALLTLGWVGVGVFWSTFPWPPAIGVAVILGVLFWLIHHQTRLYRLPTLYAFGMILLVAAAAGTGFFLTPFNLDLHQAVVDQSASSATLLTQYERLADRGGNNYTTGIVESVNTQDFRIQERNGDTDQVIITSATKFLHQPVAVNDPVIVLGHETNHVIQATLVNVLPVSYRTKALLPAGL